MKMLRFSFVLPIYLYIFAAVGLYGLDTAVILIYSWAS